MQSSKSTLTLALVLVFALASISTGLAAQTLEPEHVANLPSPSDPQISPDGRRVAWLQKVPRDPEAERGADASVLWVADADGGNAIAFTAREGRVSRPQWSPDGERLAFLDRRPADQTTARNQIYVISTRGGEAEALTEVDGGVSEFSWSGDGTSLFFTTRDVKSEEQKTAEKKGRDWTVVDQDYQHIGLWKVGLDGAEPSRLTEEAMSFREIDASPEGDRVAALAARTPKVDDSYMFIELVTVDAGTGSVSTAWDMPGKAAAPRFSPDGRWLAVRAGIHENDPFAGSLFLVAASGGETRNLTPDYDGSIDWFDFDADGGIVFAATHGTWTWLRRVDLETGEIETLVDSGPVYTRASLSRTSGTIAALADTPAQPPEVLVRAVGAGDWDRITHSYPELEAFALGRQEVIEWSARDGLRIEGMLVYPLDWQEGRRYPLVVGVHGGPESAVRNGWHTGYGYLSQLLAHRGAFFLLPNYRGSAGRGTPFLLADHGDPAGAEFQDVLDGIQHLDELELIDTSRVGIMGGSYGGYFSAWGATRESEHFKAAVVNFGVSNLFSDWGDGDIPWEHKLVHWGWFPVDRPAMAMDRSPVSWVRGSRTATLIMHGAEDPRVPAAQSRELYNGLSLNEDLPLEFVLFPREGHGYREAPHRLEACRRALAWMVEHLQLEQAAGAATGP